MKTVVFARAGNLSVGDHLTEMRAWLAERQIAARELSMVHILNMRVVFRARFERDEDADLFVHVFGGGNAS